MSVYFLMVFCSRIQVVAVLFDENAFEIKT